MNIYDGCTISTTKGGEQTYETLGFDFPLEGATVTHTGTTATIRVRAFQLDKDGEVARDKLNNPIPGKKLLVDQILDTPAPKAPGGKGDKLEFAGISKAMLDMGIAPEDAKVGFTIESYQARVVQPS